MLSQDKLGCYRVGDLKFYSKLEAIEMHAKTDIHPHWDFNEHVFNCYDWTQEPTESLAELYRQRAQQLRNQYDYIVLVYSSGADSQNALDSFINNDIKVDELLSFVNYDATGDKNNRLNKEIFEVAIPYVKELQVQHPWLKHRVIDLTQSQLKFFNGKFAKFNWIYNTNTFFNANNSGLTSLGTRFKKWQNIINQGKKLCLLWGLDKPRIFHEDNKFFVKFIDIIDNGPTVMSISGKLPYTDEAFYWTPDLPKIVIKQAHVIRRYLNNHVFTSPHITKAKTNLAYKIIDGEKMWLTSHGMHELIYPTYVPKVVTAAKPPSVVFSDRDTWFYNMEKSSRALQVYKMGLEKMWQTAPDYWKNNPNNMSAGLKACWSKSYFLE